MGVYGCEAIQEVGYNCCSSTVVGSSRIVFRQFPRSHTEATRHCYCFFKCYTKRTEKIKGGIIAEATGLDPESAAGAVTEIHAAQQAWLKRKFLSQPAGTSFVTFKTESPSGSFTVLDSSDPNQAVLSGDVRIGVRLAGADLSDREVDGLNELHVAPPSLSFEVRRTGEQPSFREATREWRMGNEEEKGGEEKEEETRKAGRRLANVTPI